MALDKATMKKLRKFCQEHPDEVAQVLLESHFWLKEVDTRTAYTRYDDDTYHGSLTVAFSPDSDGWVEVLSKQDPVEPYSHRFRTYFGGGQSERLRAALLMVALAIKLDNQERPQHRPPRRSTAN